MPVGAPQAPPENHPSNPATRLQRGTLGKLAEK
jgi:hypothetical protein